MSAYIHTCKTLWVMLTSRLAMISRSTYVCMYACIYTYIDMYYIYMHTNTHDADVKARYEEQVCVANLLLICC